MRQQEEPSKQDARPGETSEKQGADSLEDMLSAQGSDCPLQCTDEEARDSSRGEEKAPKEREKRKTSHELLKWVAFVLLPAAGVAVGILVYVLGKI